LIWPTASPSREPRGVDEQRLIADATMTGEEDIAGTTSYHHKRPHVIAAWGKVYANREGRQYQPIISAYSHT
jgi:hypothetical protein